jgi:Flp pilus assembly protein TadD
MSQFRLPINIAILFALALQGGCGSTGTAESARNLHHDTELARKLTTQGMELIGESEWSAAEMALQNAVDADVTFGPAHNNLGTVYLHQNNLYQAAWEFQYASKLMPYQPEPKSNLGLVLEQAGKLDEAVDSYDQAIQIEPDNPQYLGNAARARIRRGDNDTKVRQLLAKVVSTDTRPDWVQWAKEKLVLMGPAPTTDPEE